MINKRNDNIAHTLNGTNIIIMNITKERIYIFQHNDVLQYFIKSDGGGIHYRESLFTQFDVPMDKTLYYDFPPLLLEQEEKFSIAT